MTTIYLNSADPAAQLNFWRNVLEASPLENGIEIPGANILVADQVPSAGTKGCVLDHIGLQVRNLAVVKQRLTDAGILFLPNPNGVQVMITAPDGVRVEASEVSALASFSAFHHYHFYTVDVPAIQRWYVKTLGAIPGKRAQFEAADLPGVNFTFSPADAPLAPTAGRALDRIGIKTENMHNYAQRSQFLTDPWGTRIELRT